MTLPRWAGRFAQKSRQKARRLRKKQRTDRVKDFLFEDFGLDEIIRCDLTVCDPMEKTPKVYTANIVSRKATNATNVVRRSMDIDVLAKEMARKIHSECPHCGIQNVSVVTCPRFLGSLVCDYEYNEELTEMFWNQYRSRYNLIVERETMEKMYEEGRFRIGVDEAKGRDYTAYQELLKMDPLIQELLHD